MANKPVFFDASGRRAARIQMVALIVGAVLVVILTGFAVSLALSPPVAGLNLPGGRALAPGAPNLVKRAEKPGLLARAERLAEAARKHRLAEIAKLRQAQGDLPSRVLPAILKPQAGRPLSIGFYVNWAGPSGEASFSSLKRQLPHLDWVMPTWLVMDGPDLSVKPNIDRKATRASN